MALPPRDQHRRPRPSTPSRLVAALGTGALAVSLLAPAATAAPPRPAPAVSERTASERTASGARQIGYTQWDGGVEFRRGTMRGVRFGNGRLHFREGHSTRTLNGKRYEQATWTSPWTTPGLSYQQLIASWSATTPGDSYLEVRVRGRNGAGHSSSWDLLGRWAATDRFVQRRTDSPQDDDLARVNVDTWQAKTSMRHYQLQVHLMRRGNAVPTLDTVGAVASRLPATAGPTSTPGPGRGRVLDVPRFSQMTHRGHFPQWGGGGQAWCSPTSVSMILGYHSRLPQPAEYAWTREREGFVDLAARSVFDHDYRGAGNWSFNTAFAADRVGKGFVTRLRSMREAEQFIVAGIPLVISIAFGRGQLAGAPISASNGHLLVVVGFDAAGNVIVNDPAAPSNDTVRRTYDRAQLERAWLEASGGTTYVIHRADQPLPPNSPGNW